MAKSERLPLSLTCVFHRALRALDCLRWQNTRDVRLQRGAHIAPLVTRAMAHGERRLVEAVMATFLIFMAMIVLVAVAASVGAYFVLRDRRLHGRDRPEGMRGPPTSRPV